MPAWIQTPDSIVFGKSETLKISWAASPGTFISYRLEISPSTTNNYTVVRYVSALTHTVSALELGTYTFRVAACTLSSGCSDFKVSNEVVVKSRFSLPPPSDNITPDLVFDTVGATVGEFRVDEGGQANYSIAILSSILAVNCFPLWLLFFAALIMRPALLPQAHKPPLLAAAI